MPRSPRPSRLALAAPLPMALAAACSTAAPNNPPPSATVDASAPEADAGVDAGSGYSLDPNYPSPHAALPTVAWNGGRVLTSPSVVTVTFGADPQRATLEQFGDTITASAWWDEVRAGYCTPAGGATCVGKGTGGGHVNLPAAGLANALTDSSKGAPSSVQDMLLQHLQDGLLPPPTSQTIYVVYLPQGTTVSLDGTTSCTDFRGYHGTLTVTSDAGAAQPVAYAILPRCDSTLKTLTHGASHELIEAATDPDVGLGRAGLSYYLLSQVWSFAGGEVGDLCIDLAESGADEVLEGSNIVQRSWSNKSAAAGHDPCVPIPPGEVYFGAAPADKQQEVQLAVGGSAAISITAFSDAPATDWNLSAIDYGLLTGSGSHLGFAWDKTIVNNGYKVTLTVTLKSAPPNGAELYGIVATSGKIRHFWPAAVIQK